MSIVFLAVSVVALVLSYNAMTSRRGRFGPRWLAAMITGELAPFLALARAGLAAVFLGFGWAGGWAGRTALVLMGLSIAQLAVNHWWSLAAKREVGWAVADVIGDPIPMPRVRLLRLLQPYPAPPASIEVKRNLPYGPDPAHRLDAFLPVESDGPRPVLLQVHGGGWTGGRRDQQARPLMHRMAAAGWAVFSISYRLSPKATFPEHLVDVKRATAWIRANASEFGVDPSFLAVTGGSAGGQLAALAALTADRKEYQPGFEEADASVQACVPIYGVHELLDGSGARPKWPYLSKYVLKAEPADDPALWESASPIRSVRPDRPPFLVVHGSMDSLVSPDESRNLVAALRATGDSPVGLAEIRGATHGFDVVHSLRTERMVDGVQLVLARLWERHRFPEGASGG